MKIINFNESNSILNQYVAEIRNVEVQNDRLRFRRNIQRISTCAKSARAFAAMPDKFGIWS